MRYAVAIIGMAAFCAAGCDEGGSDGGGSPTDIGILVLVDAEVPVPDAETPTPDARPIRDAQPVPDDLGAEDAALPVDAFVRPTVASCSDACDRYARCERLDEFFADAAACRARCDRLEAVGQAEGWWSCLRGETCGLIQLCRPPEPPLPTCDAICAATVGCGTAVPGDCAADCAANDAAYRACGAAVAEDCAEGADFVDCVTRFTAPECRDFCQRQVE